MKTQFVIGLVVVAAIAAAQAQDVGILLKDPRFVQREINCILERGHCDAVGRQIKGLLPEALNNHCGRCSPQQAKNARKLMDFMRTNFPNEWRIIVQNYGARANNLGYNI